MLVRQLFDEVRVYMGVAERTGVQFERAAVRRSAGCCRSMTELIRKARGDGDGTFYVPAKVWPAGTDRLEVLKRWVVAP